MSRSMTKPAKSPVHPAKTRISLGIHSVWSVFAGGLGHFGGFTAVKIKNLFHATQCRTVSEIHCYNVRDTRGILLLQIL